MKRILFVGAIVLYLLKEGNGKGQQRPAVITKINKNGSPNMRVILDGAGDAGSEFNHPLEGQAFTVEEDQEGKIPGSWSWPQDPNQASDEEAPPEPQA